jgi:hypothetical protein
MHRARVRATTLALVVCIALGLAACSGGNPQGAASSRKSVKGVKGGTLRIANVADLDSSTRPSRPRPPRGR